MDAIAADGKFVTIDVAGEVFALGVEVVREILDPQPMAVLPQAPDFLVGIIDVRGRAVPVIDMRRKLGFPRRETDTRSRVVVIETLAGEGRTLVLGLLADAVFEVTALDESGLDLPPEVGVRWRSDYIRAIGRRLGRFVIVFDLGRLFTSAETARIVEEAE